MVVSAGGVAWGGCLFCGARTSPEGRGMPLVRGTKAPAPGGIPSSSLLEVSMAWGCSGGMRSSLISTMACMRSPKGRME